jgi:hypothetical protein
VKSWRDEDLTMFHYGEHPDAEALRAALARDPALARRLAGIARALELATRAALPEPPAGWEAGVWRRLRPALAAPAGRPPLAERLCGGAPLRSAAYAAALLLATAGAWLAGRASVTIDPAREAAGAVPPPAFTAAERERLLLASLGRHFGASTLLLTDLANAPGGAALGDERAWAESLLASNRLYRRAAERAGQRRIVALLDELEPLLVELAHAPAGATAADLQDQLEERDLLFKVRVLATRLGTGSAAAARPGRAL